MKAIILFALILANFQGYIFGTEKVQIKIVRQEKYNGCGEDFIGADRRVIYRLFNDGDKPIYLFGFSSDDLFVPTGYVLEFSQKTHQWQYPNSDNKPLGWKYVSDSEKSFRKIEPNKSLEFEACHSFFDVGKTFGRSVYISSDSKNEPVEFISEKYIIRRLK